jgi:xylose isomerase
MKQGIILGYLGQTRDRFSEYQKQRSTREMLEVLKQLPHMDGVEMVYPYQTGDPEETNGWLKKLGLKWAAINVNIKKEIEWVPGALTRPDKKLRQKAIDAIKAGKDYAKAVGAPLVTCCPLADGYDYLFQVDYPAAWKNLVDTTAQAAAYLPEIPLHLEYKFSETRVRCTLDTTTRAVLLCREVDNPALGVTIDFGHSIYGNENPAEALCILAESGYPYYIHTNDNDGRFDWDLAGGSYHFLQYVEFLFWAREYGYDHYFTTDSSPRIFDMEGIFTYHAEVTRKIWDLVGSLDRKQIRDLMAKEKTEDLLQLVREKIYRL